MSQMIVPMILDAIVTELTAVMQTAISGSDPTRAVVVKKGKWQDDPTRNNIYAVVSGGDPDDPAIRDGIVSLDEMKNIGFELPPREIGGGQAWWRRGTVQAGMYYVLKGLNEGNALADAYVVLGRLMGCLENTVVYNLSDDFGEHAVKLFCYANTMFEAGGPPAQYIWRAKVSWACLTERS